MNSNFEFDTSSAISSNVTRATVESIERAVLRSPSSTQTNYPSRDQALSITLQGLDKEIVELNAEIDRISQKAKMLKAELKACLKQRREVVSEIELNETLKSHSSNLVNEDTKIDNNPTWNDL